MDRAHIIPQIFLLQIVEQTDQHEVLPTGDELDVREVREVTEVVKRVAVVRSQPGALPESQVKKKTPLFNT